MCFQLEEKVHRVLGRERERAMVRDKTNKKQKKDLVSVGWKGDWILFFFVCCPQKSGKNERKEQEGEGENKKIKNVHHLRKTRANGFAKQI